MRNIKRWIEDDDKYEPLRITVIGEGGTGKSVLINTIVAMMQSMFQCKDCVVVCGPTGAAAYNAGGVTLHSFFGFGKRKR